MADNDILQTIISIRSSVGVSATAVEGDWIGILQDLYHEKIKTIMEIQ